MSSTERMVYSSPDSTIVLSSTSTCGKGSALPIVGDRGPREHSARLRPCAARTHRAFGEQDQAAAAHGPATDVVQRVLAQDPAREGEQVEALQPDLGHDGLRRASILGREPDVELFARHAGRMVA